jgi:3-phosphoshikimate 1-carboxyvinyltransferase
MQGLLDALSGLGAKATSSIGNGCAPIIVGEGGMSGGNTEIRGDVSSQFVSSLLISTPLARGDSFISVVDAVSRPYIDATLRVCELHGIEIERDDYSRFRIRGRQLYRPYNFSVPGDFGSAAFVMAAVALVGGNVEFSGLTASLPQADSAVMDVLSQMGVNVDQHPESIIIKADGEGLRGGSFDLSDSPDLLPVLSILALKCDDPVEIHGVAHARHKESDRIKVAVEGLQRIGARVEERHDGMRIIKPKSFKSTVLDAHEDHRMFMAFSLISLLAPTEPRVLGVESLDVSYPSFLDDIEQLGVKVVRD